MFLSHAAVEERGNCWKNEREVHERRTAWKRRDLEEEGTAFSAKAGGNGLRSGPVEKRVG